MKYYILTLVFVLTSLIAFGQKERKLIRQGNKLYNQAVENSDSTGVDSLGFANAETQYRLAMDKRPEDHKAPFNIGAAQFKQSQMAEAASQFEEVINSSDSKEVKAKAYFNFGNALLAQQKLEESIEAYKNALRNDPKDMEAKYNLEFARKMKEQKDQQQQQQQDQDKNDDQNKDQQNKDQQDKDKNDENKDQDKKDQNQDQQNKNQDQQKDKKEQQQQPKISRQNAEQMLKALQNDEKDTQEKVKKAKAAKAKSSNPEIDW